MLGATQLMGFGAGGGLPAFDIVLSADQNNVTLTTKATAAGWDGVSPAKITCTINAGVTISSTSTGTPAFATGTFPAGCVVTLINNGTIIGRGGAGGHGSGWGNGGAGGTGLSVTNAISVNNAGAINGGGGGGGGGSPGYAAGGGGGGGAGPGAATGGGGGGSAWVETNPDNGAGYWSIGGTGGSGGAAGANGGTGAASSDGYGLYGYGGAAGAAVSGNANITWLATGTRLGPIV